MPTYRATARNFAASSENKIHSDEIAQRFGFTGALVPGVAVFGHLSTPLTRRYGERWLAGSFVTTRFLKPAYDGDELSLTDREIDAQRVSIECRNRAGVLLATAECTLEATQPMLAPQAQLRGTATLDTRIEISWDHIRLNEPFAAYSWIPDELHNIEYAARVDDVEPPFTRGVLHPHAILSQANQVLVRHFIMPAWIHTGSEIRLRRCLRVGDALEVRAVPIEKWERKGHQFLKLYVAFAIGNAIATEIWHTAIFRVAAQ
jgi:acyl dehydratase